MLLHHNDRVTAGIDKPWFIPEGLITSHLQSEGFSNIIWYSQSPNQQLINAQMVNSGAPNDWVSATYGGRDFDFHVPSQVKWVAVANATGYGPWAMSQNSESAIASVASLPSSSWMLPVGLGTILLGLLLQFRSVKRRRAKKPSAVSH